MRLTAVAEHLSKRCSIAQTLLRKYASGQARQVRMGLRVRSISPAAGAHLSHCWRCQQQAIVTEHVNRILGVA